MSITLKISDRARADATRWWKSLGATQADRQVAERVYWDGLKSRLRSWRRMLRGVTVDPDDADSFWAELSPGCLVLVKLRSTRKVRWFWTHADLLVTKFNFSPGLPSRAARTTPRDRT